MKLPFCLKVFSRCGAFGKCVTYHKDIRKPLVRSSAWIYGPVWSGSWWETRSSNNGGNQLTISPQSTFNLIGLKENMRFVRELKQGYCPLSAEWGMIAGNVLKQQRYPPINILSLYRNWFAFLGNSNFEKCNNSRMPACDTIYPCFEC